MRSGVLNPLEFIQKISHTIGQINDGLTLQEEISSSSEGEDDQIPENACTICLQPRLFSCLVCMYNKSTISITHKYVIRTTKSSLFNRHLIIIVITISAHGTTAYNVLYDFLMN